MGLPGLSFSGGGATGGTIRFGPVTITDADTGNSSSGATNWLLYGALALGGWLLWKWWKKNH